jgi:hypothetical protein
LPGGRASYITGEIPLLTGLTPVGEAGAGVGMPAQACGGYMNDFYAREFWRFVFVQQQVRKLAQTAIEFPPMQDSASFNLDAIKRKFE